MTKLKTSKNILSGLSRKYFNLMRLNEKRTKFKTLKFWNIWFSNGLKFKALLILNLVKTPILKFLSFPNLNAINFHLSKNYLILEKVILEKNMYLRLTFLIQCADREEIYWIYETRKVDCRLHRHLSHFHCYFYHHRQMKPRLLIVQVCQVL